MHCIELPNSAAVPLGMFWVERGSLDTYQLALNFICIAGPTLWQTWLVRYQVTQVTFTNDIRVA